MVGLKYILIFFSILILLQSNLISQQPIQKRLVPSKAESDYYEINEIRFNGNKFLTDEQLGSILATKQTERSLPHTVLQYYLSGLEKNHASPVSVKKALSTVVKSMWSEIRYYDRLKAEEDISRIQLFYYQNGFHKAIVKFRFQPNQDFTGNILTFDITENERWKISHLKFRGLDSLPEDVRLKVNDVRIMKVDSGFSERLLNDEVKNIQTVLRNNGYYFSFSDQPVVSVDTLNFSDSISVRFRTGSRQRIGKIEFTDSTKGQSPVVYALKSSQLDLRTGDWFSQANIESSYTNLLSLGTFDMVVIDTINNRKLSDSVLDFRIFSQYRKQQEYGFALFTNQTIYNNAVNTGLEFSYFHRNIFGAAQVINPFARLVVLDLNRTLSNFKNIELEYQIGLNYSQTLAWTWDMAKIGFYTQILFSQRSVYNVLKIFTVSVPVRFPVRLPKWTYFNNMSVDFIFERQQPDRLQDVLTEMSKMAKTHDDSSRVFETLSLYSNLDSFIIKKKPILTSNLLGFSFVGDSRDNPFSPTKGRYSFLSLDGTDPIFYPIEKASGIARYAKIQLTNLWFWHVDPQVVVALKQREGYIYWFDKSESYVPFERQFFAGGANSIRGWSSRQLRYNISNNRINTNKAAYEFARDFIGNAGLIEGSLEMRYSFGRPTYVGGTIADIISSLGITTFADWGNAYQWLLVDNNGNYLYSYKWYEIFKGIALSAGLGLRYDTPVGPFRIDVAWPIYDPNREYLPFRNMQINIGLGHAF